MTGSQKISLFLLRIALGGLYFYAGITKVLDPKWSAAGYLKGAKTFPVFYHWLLQPNILPLVNFVNEWGLTLLGISLLIGIWVRFSTLGGVVLMLLYYLPILTFPLVGEHSYIVDEHIVYIFALLILSAFRAGRVWGLDSRF